MIDERARVEDGFDAAGAQAQTDVDVFPAVLRERFVESADRANRCQRSRDVRRPEVVAAVVLDAPDGWRQVVERLDLDGAAAHDGLRGSPHDCADAPRRSSAARSTSSSIKTMRSPVARAIPALRAPASPRFSWLTDGKRARCVQTRALDHRRRFIARAVVDEHDFVRIVADRLVEAGLEHALEQRRAIVGAELNRRGNHEINESSAARILVRSRFAMQA